MTSRSKSGLTDHRTGERLIVRRAIGTIQAAGPVEKIAMAMIAVAGYRYE